MMLMSRSTKIVSRFKVSFPVVWLAFFVGFSCIGCSLIKGPGPNPKYYILSPVDRGCNDNRHEGRHIQGLSDGVRPEGVVVGPVEIPAYLDRPQMIEKRKEDRLVISEMHRWAEPIDRAIERVIAVDLTRLSNGDFEACPFSQNLRRCQAHPVLRVLISVYSFEAREDGRVVLDARWRIMSPGLRSKVLDRHVCFSKMAKNVTFDNLPGVMDALIAQLTKDILSGLRAF